MSSLILSMTARWLVPPMLVGAFWILLRGHDSPGGGFAGGLVALAAYMLDAFAAGAEATRARVRLDPESLLGIGLVLAFVSASFGPMDRDPWMKSRWIDASFAGLELALGTPLLFDLGVFLVVIGSGLALVLPPLSES